MRKRKPSRVRTEQQKQRDKLLLDAGYTKSDVYAEAKRRGCELTESSVRAALDNRYRNDKVIAAFCYLTGAEPDVAFPIDEPLYKTGKQAAA